MLQDKQMKMRRLKEEVMKEQEEEEKKILEEKEEKLRYRAAFQQFPQVYSPVQCSW